MIMGLPVGPPVGGTPVLPVPGQPGPMKPGEFQPGSMPNIVSFGFDHIGPPSNLYIRRDDHLQILARTNVAGTETITVTARILLPVAPSPGQPSEPSPPPIVSLPNLATISVLSQTFTLLGTRSPNQFLIPLSEGYLLSVDVSASAARTRGQTFVRVSIQPGVIVATQIQPVLPLFADYATLDTNIGWPGHRILNPTEGPGWLHSLQQGNPVAGADWALNVNVTARMRVRALAATLTTSAAVANRQVEIIVDDSVNTYYIDDVPANIVASTTTQITAADFNVPTGIVTTILHASIPSDLILPNPHRIRSNTVNLQAGDQWSNIWFHVEEWIDGN